MRSFRRHIISILTALLLPAPVLSIHAQTNWQPAHPPELQTMLERAVNSTLNDFANKNLKAEELAVTLVDLRLADSPAQASVRGDVQIYPASVVKLFYLVAAHQWMEEGKLADSPELRRAMSDMIVYSYNEATHYVVDALTGTTSGPELPEAELKVWFEKRNAVNRYFTSLGYEDINVNKKPWCEGPYGRETQAISAFKPNRNMLTTDATARLLTAIATGKAVNTTRSAEMMKLLSRDPQTTDLNPDNQAKFTGPALPKGAKLWSKAGWTSQTRHDAVYVELPNGVKFVLVTFTTGHASEHGITRTVARRVVEGMSVGR